MDISITNSKGDIIESFHLSIKTTPDCLSKFKYSYKDPYNGNKVYRPHNYANYKLHVHNANDLQFI